MSVQVFGPDFAASFHKDLLSLFTFNEPDFRRSAIAELREEFIKPFRFLGTGSITWQLAKRDPKTSDHMFELNKALGESYHLPLCTMGEVGPWCVIQALFDVNLRAYYERYPDEKGELYVLPYRDKHEREPLTFETLMRIAQRMYYVRYQVKGELEHSTVDWVVRLTNLAFEAALRFRDDYNAMEWG